MHHACGSEARATDVMGSCRHMDVAMGVEVHTGEQKRLAHSETDEAVAANDAAAVGEDQTP